MGEYACDECLGTNTISVWEDNYSWKSANSPDTVACRDCNIVVE